MPASCQLASGGINSYDSIFAAKCFLLRTYAVIRYLVLIRDPFYGGRQWLHALITGKPVLVRVVTLLDRHCQQQRRCLSYLQLQHVGHCQGYGRMACPFAWAFTCVFLQQYGFPLPPVVQQTTVFSTGGF